MAICEYGRYYDHTKQSKCPCEECSSGSGASKPKAAAKTVYEEGSGASPAGGHAAIPSPANRSNQWLRPPPAQGAPFRPAAGAGPQMQVAPARGASHTVYSEEAEAVRLMGFLSVVLSSHDDEGAYFRLQKGVNEIGQFQTGAAVGLRDPEVSSSHALIVCTDSAIRYIDLDSTNGSLINGERTEYAELEAGDVLELGRTLLAFVPFPFLAED